MNKIENPRFSQAENFNILKYNKSEVIFNTFIAVSGSFFLISSVITGIIVFKYPKVVVNIFGKIGAKITSNYLWKTLSISPFVFFSTTIYVFLGVKYLKNKPNNKNLKSNTQKEPITLKKSTITKDSSVYIRPNTTHQKPLDNKSDTDDNLNFSEKAEAIFSHHNLKLYYNNCWITYQHIKDELDNPQKLWKLFLNPQEEFFFLTLHRALHIIKKTTNDFNFKIIESNTKKRKSELPATRDPCEPKMLFYFYDTETFVKVVQNLSEEFWDSDIISHDQGERFIYGEKQKQWGPSFTKKINKLLFFTNGGFSESGRNQLITGNTKEDKEQSIENLRQKFHGTDEQGKEIFYLHKDISDPLNAISLKNPSKLEEKIQEYREKLTENKFLNNEDLLNLQRIINYSNSDNSIETAKKLISQAINIMSKEKINELKKYFIEYEKLNIENINELKKIINIQNTLFFCDDNKTWQQENIEKFNMHSVQEHQNVIAKNIDELIKKISNTTDIQKIINMLPSPLKDLFIYSITCEIKEKTCNAIENIINTSHQLGQEDTKKIKDLLLSYIKITIYKKEITLNYFSFLPYFHFFIFNNFSLDVLVRELNDDIKKINNLIPSISETDFIKELNKIGWKNKKDKKNDMWFLYRDIGNLTKTTIFNAKKRIIKKLRKVKNIFENKEIIGNNITLYHGTDSENIHSITSTQLNASKSSIKLGHKNRTTLFFSSIPNLRYGDVFYRIQMPLDSIKTNLERIYTILNEEKKHKKVKTFQTNTFNNINEIWLEFNFHYLINRDKKIKELHYFLKIFREKIISLIMKKKPNIDQKILKYLTIEIASIFNIKISNAKEKTVGIYYLDKTKINDTEHFKNIFLGHIEKFIPKNANVLIYEKDTCNYLPTIHAFFQKNKIIVNQQQMISIKTLLTECINNLEEEGFFNDDTFNDQEISFLLNPNVCIVASSKLDSIIYYQEYLTKFKFLKNKKSIAKFITKYDLKLISKEHFNNSLKIMSMTTALLIDHFIQQEIKGHLFPQEWLKQEKQ